MQQRIAVRGIIEDKGKIFAVRLHPYKASTMDVNDFWCTPGGGVDTGESLIAAMERELIEELGVKPHIGKLLFVQQFIQQDTEQIELFFHITNPEDYKSIDLSKTSHGVEEIAEYGFIDPTQDEILPKFLQDPNIIKRMFSNDGPEFYYYN